MSLDGLREIYNQGDIDRYWCENFNLYIALKFYRASLSHSCRSDQFKNCLFSILPHI